VIREGDWGAVRKALEAGAAEGVFSAAALWMALKGDEVFHGAAGRLSRAPGAAACGTDTAFDLASLTKPMATATCLMGLVREGRATVEDPLWRHLPAFAAGPDAPRRRAVTLGHLLAHAAGLPAWRPWFEDADRPEGAEARARGVARAAAEPLEQDPGEAAVYSDVGYVLLGAVVEGLEGAPLEAAFARRVAGPLGLVRTGFNPGNAVPGPFAPDVAATAPVAGPESPPTGVVHDDNARAMGGVAGHAGLFGTARETGRWAQALLDAWHGREGFLTREVAARFLTPAARVPGSSWVLGFDTPTPPSSGGPYLGPRAVGHLGFTGTSVWLDLEREWVVVLLTNRVHTDPSGEGIRRFRPLLHAAAGRALFGDLSPAPGGCTGPAPSPAGPGGP
jgi:CubicO group peptidase (beta-lactamase class C family)